MNAPAMIFLMKSVTSRLVSALLSSSASARSVSLLLMNCSGHTTLDQVLHDLAKELCTIDALEIHVKVLTAKYVVLAETMKRCHILILRGLTKFTTLIFTDTWNVGVVLGNGRAVLDEVDIGLHRRSDHVEHTVSGLQVGDNHVVHGAG